MFAVLYDHFGIVSFDHINYMIIVTDVFQQKFGFSEIKAENQFSSLEWGKWGGKRIISSIMSTSIEVGPYNHQFIFPTQR